MSGLDRVSLAPGALRTSASTVPFETALIEADADWKYLLAFGNERGPNEKKVPNGWTTIGFDDSAFAVGPAGFGYGDEDDATELPFGTTVILLRHEFMLNDPLMSEFLVLQVDYDDGFVAYLNGTRVVVVNAPVEELGLDSVASGSHESGSAERFDLSAHVGLLRQGKNVLAVAGFNVHRASSDMSLKVALGALPIVCYANFRLKKDGGTLYLVAPDGSIADHIRCQRQVTDQSLGRSASSQAGWGYFLTPSPGSANVGSQQPKPVKSRILFAPEPGVCEQARFASLRNPLPMLTYDSPRMVLILTSQARCIVSLSNSSTRRSSALPRLLGKNRPVQLSRQPTLWGVVPRCRFCPSRWPLTIS